MQDISASALLLGRGHGLSAIRQNCQKLQGRCSIADNPEGAGTELRLVWPEKSWDDRLRVAEHGITLWYRVHAPYQNPETLVPPTVEVGSHQPDSELRCPEIVSPSSPVNALKVQQAARLPKSPLEASIIDSFHVSADFDYQNKENGYLNARINFQNRQQVAYFRMKAPQASQSFDVSQPDSSWSQAQVRLFSLSVINSLGVTLGTLNDAQLPTARPSPAGEGSYLEWIVADPSDAELQNFAQNHGIGFLPRSSWYGLPHVLIYRQQAANRFPLGSEEFLGHVRDFVPLCTEAAQKNPRLCAGRCFIGDYAPVGRLCSREDVLKQKCTFQINSAQACAAP